jgi:hypothetical protein
VEVHVSAEVAEGRLDQVERVDLGGAAGDPAQARALGCAHLDRQLRPQAAEQALDRRALAVAHLPHLILEELHGRA